MKTITIGIKTIGEGMRDFEQAFEAARRRLPYKPRTGTYFTSLEAVRNFLTPKRLALLHLIRERNPNSIYRLAQLAARSFPSVFNDVMILERHGLLRLDRPKTSRRKAVHPSVGYDTIHLLIGV